MPVHMSGGVLVQHLGLDGRGGDVDHIIEHQLVSADGEALATGALCVVPRANDVLHEVQQKLGELGQCACQWGRGCEGLRDVAWRFGGKEATMGPGQCMTRGRAQEACKGVTPVVETTPSLDKCVVYMRCLLRLSPKRLWHL